MSDLVGTPEHPDIVDHLRHGLGNVEFGDSGIEIGGLKSIMKEAADTIQELRFALYHSDKKRLYDHLYDEGRHRG